MRWAPNPIALARTIVGGSGAGRAWPRSSAEAEALVGEAFAADIDTVFYGTDAEPALMDVLRSIGDDAPKPRPLRDIAALSSVAALSKRLGPGALERILPFVAPVADVDYPPGIAYGERKAPPIKQYTEFGALDVAGVSWLDPEQGSLADCYLIASMCSLAWARPRTWYARLSRATQGTKTPNALLVQLHGERPGDHDPAPFDIPPRVPLDVGGHWIYAHSAAHDETWPALVERAYVMHVVPGAAEEPTARDYEAIGDDRKWPEHAARILVGGTSNARSAAPGERLSAKLAEVCDGALVRHPTMASTHDRSHRRDWKDARLVAGHAYSVLGVISEGADEYVVLRDPYGSNAHAPRTAIREWADGAPRNAGAPVACGENGVFACDRDRFDRYFTAFGWVELPRDPA